ncbi:helix-turn-helix domain-containing protein [Solimicrobium silvestre]|uniref:Helix-turn-helix domain n=1 Tax=Solimicrobium silvestre TaxID=2099400 RepID=A0A2S9GYJ9_9BURK|nr:helix-turn-helix domain-containing protein [Solimicrobium silvestre]PRC92736.1 Helix-turn-helix domain [Solimicrobium silvestre]
MNKALLSMILVLRLNHAAKFVLLALAMLADEAGKNIWISIDKLSFFVSMHRRTVVRTLRVLEQSLILQTVKNEHGGAPGASCHRQIDIARIEEILCKQRLAECENGGGIDFSVMKEIALCTGGALPSKVVVVDFKDTTTTLNSEAPAQDLSTYDWPESLRPDDRAAILDIFNASSQETKANQYILDELRAAMAHREIRLKVAWVKGVLLRGIERTDTGRAYEKARLHRKVVGPVSSKADLVPKTSLEKQVIHERIKKLKEAFKNGPK